MKKILLLFNLIIIAFFFSLPTYALEGDIVGPDVVYKEADRVLTLTTILPLYSSTLGDIEVLDDAYTGFGDIPGIYTINLGVVGGIQEKLIDVSVRNRIGNVIAVTQTGEDYTIILHKNYLLTQNDIIDVLVNVQMITYNSTTEIYILTDTYSDNSASPGTYTFEFHLANSAGFEQLYEVAIQVNNTEKLLPDIVEVETSASTIILNIFYVVVTVVAVLFAIVMIKKMSVKAKRMKGGLL